MKKRIFVYLFIVTMLLTSLTGCGSDAATAAEDAKEKATESVSHFVRSCDYQEWSNSSGTKIIINERRIQGDYEVIIEYNVDELNMSEEYGVTYTDNGIVYMYVDNISEELLNQLRAQ